MKPHKHAELIKAWADGAEIEYRAQGSQEWKPIFEGWSWDNSLVAECRIKPEKKQPVVRWLWAKQVLGDWQISPVFRSKEEALKTFNGEFICLEYTRTEFPE
jgi:hypothetical protein